MRDKNLTHIQLSEEIERYLASRLCLPNSLTATVVNSPTLLDDDQWFFKYPKKFEELRGLICVVYFLNEEILKWRILGDLQMKTYSWLNRKQQIEIQLLLSSKSNCIEFLRKSRRFTSFELFGNILFTGCSQLKKLRCFKRVKLPPVRPLRKRGYDDKGSRRKSEDWLEKFDYSFILEQNRREKIRNLQIKHINRIIKQLEDSVNQV